MKPSRLFTPLLFSSVLAGCCELTGDCPDPLIPGEASLGQPGCFVASYSTGAGYGSQVGTSLGNAYYDQKMNEEVAIQRLFFNEIPATVWILYESSPKEKNAYASTDGHILFGYHMFYYTVQKFNELAVSGILAHEWGHRTQFVHGWPRGNPLMELEADAFSGYYMALAKQWAWGQIQGYFANTYALGDYYFNHPQHHGTPEQRLAAAYLGVNTAIEAMRMNRPLSYQELHAIFTQQLASRVVEAADVPRLEPAAEVEPVLGRLGRLDLEGIARGRHRGAEVTYPTRLKLAEVERLRPFRER